MFSRLTVAVSGGRSMGTKILISPSPKNTKYAPERNNIVIIFALDKRKQSSPFSCRRMKRILDLDREKYTTNCVMVIGKVAYTCCMDQYLKENCHHFIIQINIFQNILMVKSTRLISLCSQNVNKPSAVL